MVARGHLHARPSEKGEHPIQGAAKVDTRHIAKDVDRDATHAGRGWLRHPHRLPRSAAQGGICPDPTHALPIALHQRTDWMGERKHGFHHERQEKGTGQSLAVPLLTLEGETKQVVFPCGTQLTAPPTLILSRESQYY